MNCLYYLISLIFLFNLTRASCQTSSADQSSDYNNIKAYYQNEIGDRSHLYTGKEYPPYKAGIQGTQFFISPQMQHSTLFYDGVLFEDVPMLFDLVRHDVVINRYESNTRIKLLNEKIKYFIISGHRFENLTFREVNSEQVSNDFFDIIFSGRVDVLVNRIKKIEMTLNPEDPPKFTERDKFFIRNDNNIYSSENAKSIVKALSDKKDQVKVFIRKNKFKFKNNAEEEIVKVAAYYETLIK